MLLLARLAASLCVVQTLIPSENLPVLVLLEEQLASELLPLRLESHRFLLPVDQLLLPEATFVLVGWHCEMSGWQLLDPWAVGRTRQLVVHLVTQLSRPLYSLEGVFQLRQGFRVQPGPGKVLTQGHLREERLLSFFVVAHIIEHLVVHVV